MSETQGACLPAGWRLCPLGDIATRVIRRNHIDSDNILTISARHGLVNQEEYFQRKVASSDRLGYWLLHRGDFAYNKSYSDGYPAGVVRRLENYDFGVVSPLYICFRPDERHVDPSFLAHYFDSGLLDDDLLWVAKEGARNHGLLNVRVDDFFNLPLLLPTLEEQRRIAEILDIFDERLAVTKKIVDKLRSIKLGMRNDIFQNLTAEECAIGELGQVVTGSTPPSDEAIWGDVLPFVTPAEMGDWEFVDSSPRALSSQGQGLVRKIPRGSLLAVCIGFSYGKLGVAGVDLCTNQQINSLIPRDGIYGRYLYLALGQHIERLKGLSGLQVTPIVNKRLFSSILLPVPDTLEQQRIVDRLSAVQARIDSELGEVSKLESLKHALAEDLLTGRVRVPEAEAVVESL